MNSGILASRLFYKTEPRPVFESQIDDENVSHLILNSNIKSPQKTMQLTKYMFEHFPQKYFFEINKDKVSKIEFYPLGEHIRELVGQKLRGQYMNYEVQKWHIDRKDEKNYAIREKIYLEPKSLDNRKFWEKNGVLREVSELLKTCTAVADEVSSLLKMECLTSDLIMFIKYSVVCADEEKRNNLSYFCSFRFGVPHDDETLFSFHLGETEKEFSYWNYKCHQWELSKANQNYSQFIFGDYARNFGYIPTTHRLAPTGWAGNSARYCAIFDRSELSENRQKEYLVDFEKFLLGTCIVFLKDESSPYIDSGKTQAIARSFGVPVFSCDGPINFSFYKERGYSKAIFIKSDSLLVQFEHLHSLATCLSRAPEKYIYRLQKYGNDIFLAQLARGKAEAIDKLYQKLSWDDLLDEIPTYVD